MRRRRIRLVATAATIFLVVGAANAWAADQPNPELTPGNMLSSVTQTNISTTICSEGFTRTARRVSRTTRDRVYARYDVRRGERHLYVIDHLIPLELGGSSRLSNLWPQRKEAAHAKDKVENSLKSAVCNRRVMLADAQNAIARDYRSAGLLATTTSTSSSTTTTTQFIPPPQLTQPAAPLGPPAGATALCNDGTYSYAAHHQGACSHHGGVAVFYT